MRSALILAAAIVAASPAVARDAAPFYGAKHGAFGEGFKHSVEKDGSWRIVTEYHTRDPLVALDVALYRAAEMARELGKPYVQVLGGYGQSSYAVASGFVYARPSDSPAAPTDCRDKQCYTADVAKVLVALGGASGHEPGVARPSLDQYGRQVMVSGYGTGAIAWARR